MFALFKKNNFGLVYLFFTISTLDWDDTTVPWTEGVATRCRSSIQLNLTGFILIYFYFISQSRHLFRGTLAHAWRICVLIMP